MAPIVPKWWGDLKHFSPGEFSYPHLMEESFMGRLDRFRDDVGLFAIILSSNDPEEKHSKNSLHYRGLAVDLIFPTAPSMLDVLLRSFRYFNGIGVYPKWKRHDAVGGFHVEHDPGRSMTLTWMGVPSEYGGQVYIGLNEANMRRYGAL